MIRVDRSQETCARVWNTSELFAPIARTAQRKRTALMSGAAQPTVRAMIMVLEVGLAQGPEQTRETDPHHLV